jgi:peptidoglycan hydrolase-like protein with peptidoglycan-binding domain
MKGFVSLFLVLIALSAAALAQGGTAAQSSSAQLTSDDKPKKVIFRPTKDQIVQVQTMLKQKKLFNGEATGKLDPDTRTSIKSWQKDNGLKETGTLNRATLEKMGIELTERQKSIPVSDSSYASSDKETKAAKTETKTAAVMSSTAEKAAPGDEEGKPKKTIFRATKDQINAAQKILKDKGMYGGEETGKLDDATREGLKKYQDDNGLKVTGTLNQVTLEKMGIELTEKQKGDSPAKEQ